MLLVGLMTVTAVTGIASTASAATFSVRQAQWNLAGFGEMSYAGIDGRIGTTTTGALKRFQTKRCIGVDGLIGPVTTEALSSLMKQVQAKVGASPVDGMNGPNTRQKIADWQRRNGLTADGQAGEKTLTKMGITYTKNCPRPPTRCATGTTDLGVHETYVRGVPTRQTLCAIRGFRSSGEESTPGKPFYIPRADGNVIVSYTASAKVRDMFNAAQRAGVTMRARSSFRTFRHQEQLCDQDPACNSGASYAGTAKEGWSPHQSGIAIDFIMNDDGLRAGATCTNNRSKGRNDRTWNWLYNNAHNYGFRQYAAEAWHWEYTARSSTRC